MAGVKEVVLITGGAGCLAQHLIRELQLRYSDRIQEIRVADKKLFKKFLDYPDKIPIREFVVDVVEEEELEKALNGVTTVFHLCARKYHFDMYPDKRRQWEDSVVATKVLVHSMCKMGIEWLLYVGDAMSVLPATNDAQAPVELGTMDPPASKSWLMGEHGEAKFRAEEIIRRCNGRRFDPAAPREGTLKTVSIRPTPLYGEGDNWIVPYSLEVARDNGGKFYHMGKGINVLQMTYAGNCAAMLVETWKHLQERPEEFGGEVFFCTEPGKCQNFFDYIEPFIEGAGFKMVRSPSIPYFVAFFGLGFLNMVCWTLSKLDIYFAHNLPNFTIARVASGLNFHFPDTKARLMMDWEAPYDKEQSMKTTIDWWRAHYRTVFA